MSNQIIMPSVGLEGRFRIEIRKNGILVREIPWFRNVITDGGFTEWYTNGIKDPKLYVGSSNQTPSVTDIDLAAPVGSGSVMDYTASLRASAAPWYTENIYKTVFPMNTIMGNLAEIGVKNSQGVLFSRTLIKDASGNPSAISVVANEEVTVYYSIRQYEDLSDVTGTFQMGSETYNYTSYAMTEPDYVGVREYILDGWYGWVNRYVIAETEVPANARQAQPHSSSAFPYISSERYANSTTAESGNAANRITSCWFDYGCNANGDLPMKTLILDYMGNNPRRVVFDPPMPKNNTRKLTFVSELSASRY